MPGTIDRSLAPIPQRVLPMGAEAPAAPASGVDIKREWARCLVSPEYFIDTYCHIYDADPDNGRWIPFKLWPAQVATLRLIHANPLTAILKARQLGLTWLILGYILWQVLFKPVATVSIFSKRQEEADYLLGIERLKGMFYRLPIWMQYVVLVDNTRHWQLSNGSVVRSFPTSAGDSYTATFAFADEFDLVEDQDKLIRAVKPTIDGGGKMVLLSKADKSNPQSPFKRVYMSGKKRNGPWTAIFLPWYIRPSRDAAWYQAQVDDSILRTHSLDDVHEGYPATDVEALAPRSQDKRLPAKWLQDCYREMEPLVQTTGPAIPEMEIYSYPVKGREYVMGGDPAEGNPTSDDSSLHVLEWETGEEVCHLAGRYEPEVFASYMKQISTWYNKADMLPERNNHGHVVIAWLQNNGAGDRILEGTDGKPGWLTTSASKANMYASAAMDFKEGDATIHSFETITQLFSIEAATLRAPKNQKDDRATSYVLALKARFLDEGDEDSIEEQIEGRYKGNGR